MGKAYEILKSARRDNTLTDSQFLELRRTIFQDSKVCMEEADLIFTVDTNVEALPEGWNDFFVGALTDFLIRQTLPIGYVDPIHSSWLMERIEQDDHLEPETELELLLNILRLAEDVPESLELYALNKVRDRIINRTVENGMTVTEQDVDELKRILYAAGGSGGFYVCEHEARFLFDLDEISQHQDNHPSWQKLFVGAIANHVMTMAAPETVAHDDYKRAQQYLHSTSTINWNLKASFKSWEEQYRNGTTGPIRSQFLDEERIRDAEAIDAAEAAWLIKHINRDGEISANEIALLTFFKEECPEIHESLLPLLRYAA